MNFIKSTVLAGIILSFIFISACHDNTTDPKNEPPYQPSLAAPESEATYVSLDIELIWSCTDPENDTLFYDVFFGTSINPPIVVENTRETFYTPDTLLSYTTYYWKIIARDETGDEAESDIWSFTTTYRAGYEKSFPLGDTGLMHEMVWIPPGSFMMGAVDADPYSSDHELPRHEVTISKGFWLGKYEVTNKEFRLINYGQMDTTMHQNKPVSLQFLPEIFDTFLTNINSSEEFESWYLPSEAEWEYACRAGNSDSIFWWGNDFEGLYNFAWFFHNSNLSRHEVGLLMPNPWNLYDILGNALELCEDDYHSSFDGAPTDGSSWIEIPREYYTVVKGGYFASDYSGLRPSARFIVFRFESMSPVGFRLKRIEQ